MIAMKTNALRELAPLLQIAHQNGFQWEELKLLAKILPLHIQDASVPFISICEELEQARKITMDMLKVFLVSNIAYFLLISCRHSGYAFITAHTQKLS